MYILDDPFCSAKQAVRALQAGEVTAAELLAMQIARIIDLNPALNQIRGRHAHPDARCQCDWHHVYSSLKVKPTYAFH